MKSKILVLFVLFVCSSFVKPLPFNIHKELEEAQRIVKGTILSYDTENIIIKFQNKTTNKIDSAVVAGGLLNESSKEIDNKVSVRNKLTLSGKLPAIGEEVLMVISDKNYVRLFAYEKKDYYRFWTPIMAGSLSIFHFESPALPIFPNDSYYNVGDGRCFDGCLYPIDQIELRQ
ncbi:hypothetical protein [Bernardetia sp. MNP-M8]|uniref:hypothetical protein n=1 Tax=Bernardetia sp. MNP-M8 TaxID=3127470 RepID=UPI0030CAE408